MALERAGLAAEQPREDPLDPGGIVDPAHERVEHDAVERGDDARRRVRTDPLGRLRHEPLAGRDKPGRSAGSRAAIRNSSSGRA